MATAAFVHAGQTSSPAPAADRPATLSLPTRTIDLPTTEPSLLIRRVHEETTYQPETANGVPPPPGRPEPTPRAKLPVLSDDIHQTVGGGEVRGYRARPQVGEPVGAVLLIPEWWGLNRALRETADRWASKGLIAFAADLYEGRWTEDRREAARLMASVDPAAAVAALRRALDWLARSGAPGRELSVGVVGWGWGGSLALQLAVEDARPAAVVIYYGEPIVDPERLARIRSPLLGIYADLDGWVTPERVADFKQALAGAGVAFNVLTYSVQPGFALAPRNDREAAYAQLAEEQALEFLTRHLSAPRPR